MKGKYKNLQGEIIDILQHDEANKIVYIRTVEGETKWISTEDSKWWQPLDVQPKTVEEVKIEQIINKEPPIGKSVSIEELKEEVKPVEVEVPKEEPTPIVLEEKPVVQKPKGKKK